ncbi:hypothetical protein [Rhodoblastus sp.]|uniref:hypothetical protein n=1 Tax=Rhodoblastus sp. TaxID=1962975 RepID=UPI00261B4283|nr:hypothetical protein [Rhodoblastus sp.]
MIRTEIARQNFKEFSLSILGKTRERVQGLPRDDGAGRFSSPGQQRLAERGRVLGGKRRFGEWPGATIEKGPAAFGNARQEVGKEGIAHHDSLRSGAFDVSPPLAAPSAAHPTTSLNPPASCLGFTVGGFKIIYNKLR